MMSSSNIPLVDADKKHQHGSVENHQERNLLGNDKLVREALTRIWISQQRNETNNSFEIELNHQNESVGSQNAGMNESSSKFTDFYDLNLNTEIVNNKDHYINVIDEDEEREGVSLLTKRLQGRNGLNIRKPGLRIPSENEDFLHLKADDDIETMSRSDANMEVPLKLPQLIHTTSLSKQSSINSNASSPSTTSPSHSPRMRVYGPLRRSRSGLVEEDLHRNSDITRSLPASPHLKRMLAHPNELSSPQQTIKTKCNNRANYDAIDETYLISSPTTRRRRPDTPITRDLSIRHVGSLSRSCSDLHLIDETSAIYQSKKNKNRLFPNIVK